MQYYKMDIRYSWDDMDYCIRELPKGYDLESEESVWNINELEAIEFEPNLAFKIHSKVQRYDIFDTYNGLGVLNSFFASERLHPLLQTLNMPKLQIIKTEAIHKKKIYAYYYYHFLEELGLGSDFVT